MVRIIRIIRIVRIAEVVGIARIVRMMEIARILRFAGIVKMVGIVRLVGIIRMVRMVWMGDRHGPGKTFSYVATCKKLKNPIVVKRGDAEYTIKYQYFAEPCKLNSTEVKTMTGGELALVGGKLTFTGKKLLRGGYDDDEYKEKEEFEIDGGDEEEEFEIDGGDEDEEFQEEVEKVE
jgi:hypothetical protein